MALKFKFLIRLLFLNKIVLFEFNIIKAIKNFKVFILINFIYIFIYLI